MDGGKFKKRIFQLLFTIEEPSTWNDTESGKPELVEDVLQRVVTDWKGVGEAKDKPIEFDEALFEKHMILVPYMNRQIFKTYMDNVLPGIELKN